MSIQINESCCWSDDLKAKKTSYLPDNATLKEKHWIQYKSYKN